MSFHRLLKHRKTLIITLCFVLIAFLLIFFKSSPQKTNNVVGLFVKTQVIKAGFHRPQMPIIATAKAQKDTKVTAFVTSKVNDVHFSVGQAVKKNMILVQLDDQIYQNDVEKFKAMLERIKVEKNINQHHCIVLEDQLNSANKLLKLLKTNYQRNLKMHEKKYVSTLVMDVAEQKQVEAKQKLKEFEFELQNCRLKNDTIDRQITETTQQLKNARKNLLETKVRAPYDGIITQKDVSPGQTVNIGETLLSLYAPDSIELEALIPDSIAETVKNGRAIDACHEISGAEICFKLSRVADNVSRSGVGYVAYFEPNQKQKINNGDTFRLHLRLPPSKSFVIPAPALYLGKYVYLIENHRLKRIKVTRLGFASSKQQNPSLLIGYQQNLEGRRILTSYLPDARTGFLVKYTEASASEQK